MIDLKDISRIYQIGSEKVYALNKANLHSRQTRQKSSPCKSAVFGVSQECSSISMKLRKIRLLTNSQQAQSANTTRTVRR